MQGTVGWIANYMREHESRSTGKHDIRYTPYAVIDDSTLPKCLLINVHSRAVSRNTTWLGISSTWHGKRGSNASAKRLMPHMMFPSYDTNPLDKWASPNPDPKETPQTPSRRRAIHARLAAPKKRRQGEIQGAVEKRPVCFAAL